MSTPLWRQMYNSWEKAVSPSLEDLTASNGFRDVLALGLRANAELAREIERASRQWLHLWNLPAASDVTRLRTQVASLERELLSMRLELERAGETTTTSTTGSSTTVGPDLDAEVDGAAGPELELASTNGRTAA